MVFRGLALVACVLAGLLPDGVSAAVTPRKRCPGPPLVWQRVAPQAYWIAGAPGESNELNRGITSNRLVVKDGARVWLLGSGPSPVAGAALACQLEARLGWGVTDVINPWARPELVLGNRAFAAARIWAHEDVRQAMQSHCPQCVARMKLRLGPAASDLDGDPIRLATHTVRGDQGSLGPWRWWRLSRAAGVSITVWRLHKAPLWAAPGLLWADHPPDLRDADPQAVLAASQRLLALAEKDGDAARWLPEQGDWLPARALDDQVRYLQALLAAVRQRQQDGELETLPPPPMPGWTGWLQPQPQGMMNWQRTWRWLENDSLNAPVPAPVQEPPRDNPQAPDPSR